MTERANGEASIYKRKDGRFEVRWYEYGRRRTAYSKTNKAAKATLRDALAKVEQGHTGLGSAMPFKAWAKHLETELLPHAMSRSKHGKGKPLAADSKDAYRYALNSRIWPALDRLPLRSMTSADVQLVFTQLVKDGMSGAYANTVHKTLVRVFAEARKANLIAKLPLDDLDIPAQKPKDRIVPTIEQLDQLITAAPDDRMRLFVTALAHTGLRISELLSVKWADVDLDDSTILIHGKGDKDRTIPITAGLSAELMAWRKIQRTERLAAPVWWDEDWLMSASYGRHWDASTARREFRPLVREICPGLTPHGLRHSAATVLLEQGAPTKVVSELLGHASARITQDIYQHVRRPMLDEAASALDKALGG
jgi:integrase